jgi:hypothetical protein
MSHLIEELFKNPKTVITTHTSNQATSTTGDDTNVILGSEITYEPAENSSKVVYEISFYAEKINGYNFSCIFLEEYSSGSWSEINERFRRNTGNWNHAQSQRWYFHFKFVLPAWTGSKQLRLNNKGYITSAGTSLSMHQLTEWDGSGSITDKFCNTNLLVYSI